MTDTTTEPTTTPAPTIRPARVSSLTMRADTFKRAALAVTGAASTDGARPILTAVHIEYDPTHGFNVTGTPWRMTATDSYRMYVITPVGTPALSPIEPGGTLTPLEWHRALIDAKQLTTWAKNVKRTWGDHDVITLTFAVTGTDYGRGTVTLTRSTDPTGTNHGTVPLTEGEYPKTGTLWPAPDTDKLGTVGRLAFNPRYLSGAALAAGSITDTNQPVTITSNVDRLKPALITAHSDALTFAALLMPVRTN